MVPCKCYKNDKLKKNMNITHDGINNYMDNLWIIKVNLFDVMWRDFS